MFLMSKEKDKATVGKALQVPNLTPKTSACHGMTGQLKKQSLHIMHISRVNITGTHTAEFKLTSAQKEQEGPSRNTHVGEERD